MYHDISIYVQYICINVNEEQTGSIGKSHVYTMAALRVMPKDTNEDPVGCPPRTLAEATGWRRRV